jgi:LAO/AO transport system kinase
LIDVAGWDIIVLETVGAGQSETEIAEVADINVVVNAPGLGDDVQAIKAGILEIADVLVVNKADCPLARRTERQLKAMLQLRREECRQVPVVNTIATTGTGVDKLAEAITDKAKLKCKESQKERLLERTRRLIAQEAAEQVKYRVLNDQHPNTWKLLASVVSGDCDFSQAISRLLSQYYAQKELDTV